MKIAIIGSGGREHALGYSIKKSPLCEKIFFLPGNGGTTSLGENINVNLRDHAAVASFMANENINLVVIGPEIPIVDGLGDHLRAQGLKVFAPSKEAARVESEKTYAKMIMAKYGIPTADYREFSSSQLEEAIDYLRNGKFPVVLKADGLAAGKGVVIATDMAEAEAALREMMVARVFGDSGDRVVIEEFMAGEEASIFAITDGNDFVCLPAAQDHKRIGEGDTGSNTGGMGAYAPAPLITPELQLSIEEKVIKPFLGALREENNPFAGCLYAGLMITAEGPKVVEFNCRFGDPETQAVLPVVKGDILRLLYSVAAGELDKSAVTGVSGAAVCVVAASGGYPGNFEKGFIVSGIENVSGSTLVFHAGTSVIDGETVTSGGRVLGVTGVSAKGDISEAVAKAYAGIREIKFTNIYFRKDIAHRALRNN